MNESTQVTLRFRPGLRLSDRAFAKLCAANPDLRLERTARGELEIMAPASSGTGGRNAALTARLFNWVDATGRGKAFDSSAGFILPNGATRSPDTSWISGERWDALDTEERETFSHICPDFVVELRSKTDDVKTLRKKMREYIAQGARLGWLLDPFEDEALIYRPGRRVEVIKSPKTLSGEDVLPGFVLDLKGILFD
jgi:Uma2 family endonuclease